MRLRTLFLLTAVALGQAAAQDATAPLVGMWYGEITLQGGRATEIQMRVDSASGGTWTASPRGGRLATPNPCFGRPLPLAITAAGDTFSLYIQASKEVRGCTDGRATVKRIDERHLEGSFADGRPLQLTRR